jgi:hypothetical protein
MKLGHEHRSGYAFAGYIAYGEEELPIGRNQIAIVSADRANRSIVIARIPNIGAQSWLGQELALNL